MKTTASLILVGLALIGGSAPLNAQIRDNASSATALAIQCAVSSGYSAQDYESYCRRLAKTLGMLSSAQQTRVFGYLPMPGGSEGGSEEPTPAAAKPVQNANPESGAAVTPTKETAPVGNSPVASPMGGSSATGGGGSADSSGRPSGLGANFLVDLVRKVNNNLDGTVETTAPIVAGATGVDLSGSTAPVTNLTGNVAKDLAGTSTGGGSGSWDALIQWFKAADAAYKAGTLNSFLQGGI